ncbi:MAG: sigma-70 family RNA polymerase sigma factor [Clostridia bacterium]
MPKKQKYLILFFLEFCRFTKKERNLRRSDERHNERSELSDEALYERAFNKPDSIEKIVTDDLRAEMLNLAISKLTQSQRHRFFLYYDSHLTYEQIAKIESCSFQAVAKSIKSAEKSIISVFKNY